MDIQLQELLDKIKREGIEGAQESAAKIKAEAEAEAARIVGEAKKEAASIVEQGKADAARSEKAGSAAIKQAARNLTLAFKEEIQKMLDTLAKNAVEGAYTADLIKSALPGVLKNWQGSDSLAVMLTESDLAKLDGAFKSEVAKSLKGGVDLKPVKGLSAGMRIAEKDGSAFYDFSAESCAALFSAYLNPKLAALLQEAAVGE